MRIYLASSWRNEMQPPLVAVLRYAGHEVYDFRHPSHGDDGFHWSNIDPNWKTWEPHEYIKSLGHPIAASGFRKDMAALAWCEVCVLLNPCGRSAHLELGWAIGAGKSTIIHLAGMVEPELMYKMAHRIVATTDELLALLKDWSR